MANLVLGACASSPDVQVFSESVRLAAGKPSPRHSAVFDGHGVRLRGARGETLGLEVRISDGQRRSIKLELPDAIAEVRAFSVLSLPVRDPSSDMYGESAGPGAYPDVLVPTDGVLEANDLAYYDVTIRGSATPGHYRGELVVDGRASSVELDVSRARIDLGRDPLVWVSYSPSEIARASGLTDDDEAELVTKEAEYDALFRAHGAYLAADVPPSRFAARKSLVHGVAYWPIAVDKTSDQSIREDVARWLALFRDVRAIPFVIPIDEPASAEQKRRARHIAQVIGAAGGGAPALLRGVTDVISGVYDDSMDLYVSPKNFPVRAGEKQRSAVRFWTYNGRPPEAGSMILDTEGAALRTWGWIAERYGIELWYAWEGLYFSDRNNGGGPTDVMHDPVTFDERRKGGKDWGNGDGVLAYPGPLPSLRLKVLRRGLEDRLLLKELESCGGAEQARDIVRRTVPRALGEAAEASSWPANEIDWEHARGEVLDAIEARCHDAA